MKKRIRYTVLALVIFGFLFQTVLRYTYLKDGLAIVRIDRVTGSSCVLPCAAPTPYNEKQAQAAYNQALDDEIQRAIATVKSNPQAQSIVNSSNPFMGYEWKRIFDPTVWDDLDKLNLKELPKTIPVCYCDSKGTGWAWEYHADNSDVYFIDDNEILKKKYNRE